MSWGIFHSSFAKMWAGAALILLIGLAAPATAQQPAQESLPSTAGSGINVSKLLGGALGQVFGPTLAPPSNGETLPPGTDHLIPIKTETVPNSIVVDNDEGLVRLVVRDAPLRQVLALLAESQKLNLVFSTSTEVRVTVSLDRVPLEVALDAILSTCGHTWARRGEVIHITEVNATTLLTPSVQGRRLEVLELDFLAAEDVDLAVKALLSPIGKSWILESDIKDNRRTREIVAVEDLPEYVDRIISYVAQIDQPPRQVLVEVQILQVDLNNDIKHGVNFENLNASGAGIRFSTTGVASSGPQPFFFEVTAGDLTSLVELLEITNDAKTLASPKLLAVNGQESRIQIGEKLPYRLTTTTQTSTQESVNFLDVGVVLTFTPWITRDGRVLMHIAPKVSDGAVNSNTGLPEEETTEVETDVFLADGQGVIIGGLISERDVVNQSKIPLLGDIPYVGVLFQRRQAVRKRSEILVALMPHILPYNPSVQCANDHEVGRARDPLVYGPLDRYPRPYEPRLPDPVNLGREHCHERLCLPVEQYPGQVTPPSDAPSEPCAAPYAIRRLPPPPDQSRQAFAPPAMRTRVAMPPLARPIRR